MSAVGQTLEPSGEIGPTIPELLTMAADIVAMVSGRVESVEVGFGGLAVHVADQGTAEYLAWRLGLDRLREYPDRTDRRAFAVWSGGSWPEPRYEVFYAGELSHPLRVFPRSSRPTTEPVPRTGEVVR